MSSKAIQRGVSRWVDSLSQHWVEAVDRRIDVWVERYQQDESETGDTCGEIVPVISMLGEPLTSDQARELASQLWHAADIYDDAERGLVRPIPHAIPAV